MSSLGSCIAPSWTRERHVVQARAEIERAMSICSSRTLAVSHRTPMTSRVRERGRQFGDEMFMLVTKRGERGMATLST